MIVIILATAANILLKKYTGLETDTIGSRYGSIPSTLPSPLLPQFSVETITALFPTSISIAVLAAIESLLSAVVADGMTGTKHDSDTELIAQGIANIASPIFGGIPATGAIARTATNIKNGGKTPVAGIIHAITLLLIMLILGKYAVYIPMAALSAVLINVSWNMAGFPAVKALLKGQKSDIFVLAATFLITVFIDLTVAIEFGLGFAAFFFIKKMIDVSEVQNKRDSIAGGGLSFNYGNTMTPENRVPSSMPMTRPATSGTAASFNDFQADLGITYARPTERYNVGYIHGVGINADMGVEWFMSGRLSLAGAMTFTPLMFVFQPQTWSKFEGYSTKTGLVEKYNDLVSPGSHAVLYGTENIGINISLNYYF